MFSISINISILGNFISISFWWLTFPVNSYVLTILFPLPLSQISISMIRGNVLRTWTIGMLHALGTYICVYLYTHSLAIISNVGHVFITAFSAIHFLGPLYYQAQIIVFSVVNFQLLDTYICVVNFQLLGIYICVFSCPFSAIWHIYLFFQLSISSY